MKQANTPYRLYGMHVGRLGDGCQRNLQLDTGSCFNTLQETAGTHTVMSFIRRSLKENAAISVANKGDLIVPRTNFDTYQNIFTQIGRDIDTLVGEARAHHATPIFALSVLDHNLPATQAALQQIKEYRAQGAQVLAVIGGSSFQKPDVGLQEWLYTQGADMINYGEGGNFAHWISTLDTNFYFERDAMGNLTRPHDLPRNITTSSENRVPPHQMSGGFLPPEPTFLSFQNGELLSASLVPGCFKGCNFCTSNVDGLSFDESSLYATVREAIIHILSMYQSGKLKVSLIDSNPMRKLRTLEATLQTLHHEFPGRLQFTGYGDVSTLIGPRRAQNIAIIKKLQDENGGSPFTWAADAITAEQAKKLGKRKATTRSGESIFYTDTELKEIHAALKELGVSKNNYIISPTYTEHDLLQVLAIGLQEDSIILPFALRPYPGTQTASEYAESFLPSYAMLDFHLDSEFTDLLLKKRISVWGHAFGTARYFDLLSLYNIAIEDLPTDTDAYHWHTPYWLIIFLARITNTPSPIEFGSETAQRLDAFLARMQAEEDILNITIDYIFRDILQDVKNGASSEVMRSYVMALEKLTKFLVFVLEREVYLMKQQSSYSIEEKFLHTTHQQCEQAMEIIKLLIQEATVIQKK